MLTGQQSWHNVFFVLSNGTTILKYITGMMQTSLCEDSYTWFDNKNKYMPMLAVLVHTINFSLQMKGLKRDYIITTAHMKAHVFLHRWLYFIISCFIDNICPYKTIYFYFPTTRSLTMNANPLKKNSFYTSRISQHRTSLHAISITHSGSFYYV